MGKRAEQTLKKNKTNRYFVVSGNNFKFNFIPLAKISHNAIYDSFFTN